MTQIAGGLGSGKTTLICNLLKAEVISNEKTGIIIMDGAGDIDYQRVEKLANDRGFPIFNATSACTVCDGPHAVFKRIESLESQGIEKILLELSGQMPLSTMTSRLAGKGITDGRALYLLNPKDESDLPIEDELLFAKSLGITGKDPSVNRYLKINPELHICTVDEKFDGDLKTLFPFDREKKLYGKATQSVKSTNQHIHSKGEGQVTKFFSSIQNPYIDLSEFQNLVGKLEGEYDRLKGYIAIDRNRVCSFDSGKNRKLTFSVTENNGQGNGLILVINRDGNFFSQERLESKLARVLEKPEVPPRRRIGSSRDEFQKYIDKAFKAREFDAAFGAAEQYQFENGDSSLIESNLDRFVKDKFNFLENTNLENSQKVLQLGSLVYTLRTHNPQHSMLEECEVRFKSLFDTITIEELEQVTDSETIEFIESLNQELKTKK